MKIIIQNFVKRFGIIENKRETVAQHIQSKGIIRLVSINSPLFEKVTEEFRFLKTIAHPNLPKVKRSGFVDKYFFYEVPFFEKIDPREYCIKQGKEAFLNIFLQTLNALNFLHKRNRVHGKISFDNIIIEKNNTGILVKLLFCSFSNPFVDINDNILPDKKSDIFALGLYLYKLITGKSQQALNNLFGPINSHAPNSISAIEPLFEIDYEVLSIIEKMIKPNPDERFNNCDDILSLLYDFLAQKEKKSLLNKQKQRKIDVTYCSFKKIKSIVNSIKNSQSSTMLTTPEHYHICLDFLTLELDYNNIRYFIINEEDKNLKNILKNQVEINSKDGLFIIFKTRNIKALKKEFENLLKSNTDLKLITVFIKTFATGYTATRLINMQKLSSKEYKEFLVFKLGNDVVDNDFIKIMKKKCGTDIYLTNKYIDLMCKTGILKTKYFRWKVNLDKLQKLQLPESITKGYLENYNFLTKDEKELLSKIALWKSSFTIKEISRIFNYKIIVLDNLINNLKKYGFLAQNSIHIYFSYDFFKAHIIKITDDNLKSRYRLAIVSYLCRLKLNKFNDIVFFMDILSKSGMYDKMLYKGLEYLSLFNNDSIEYKELARILYENIDNFINAKVDKKHIYQILKNYFYAVALLEKLNDMEMILKKAKSIFDKNSPEFYYHTLAMEISFIRYKSEYKKIIELYEKIKDNENNFEYDLRNKLLYGVGRAYLHINKVQESIEIFEKLLKNIKSKDYSIKTDCYLNIGIGKYLSNDIAGSLNYLKKAQNIARTYNLKTELGKIYLNYGFIYMNEANYEKALKCYKKAEKIKDRYHIKYMEFNINYGLADISYHTGDEYQALLYIHKIKKEFVKSNVRDFYYRLLTEVLISLGAYNTANYFLEKAIDYFKKNRLNNSLYAFFVIALSLAIKTGDSESIKNYQKMINEYEKYAFLKDRQTGSLVLVESYIWQKNYKKAEEVFNFIKKNFFSRSSIDKRIHYKKVEASLFYLKNNVKRAFKAINVSIDLLKTIENDDVKALECYYLAYQIGKKAFKQKIFVDDYRNYLNEAYKIVNKRLEYLPNNKMRRRYREKELVKNVLKTYEEEIINSSFTNISSILLDSLGKISKIIKDVSSRDKLFSEILKIALSATKAERGVIIIINPKTMKQKIECSYHVNKDSLQDISKISEKIINDVFKKKKALWHTNVLSNNSFDNYRSYVDLKIESVICLPLIIHKKVLGVIYLDSKKLLTFTPEEIKFLNIFAQISASTIETSKNYTVLRENNENLSKYIKNERKIFKDIIGNSPKMITLYKKMEQVAKTDVNVLVEGESGTGKELVAKNIYKNSIRCDKPFIAVDCGSLSETLIESELFGHVKGAFTGAISNKKGIFEEADGGTIFLDEISNISLNMQAKLLRLIQEGEFKRVGDNKVRKVDVRIIAASNIPLKKLVREGKFREDLFYRLTIFPLEIPALRERKTDITILAYHFLNFYSTVYKKEIAGFEKEAIKILENYYWPGNVRQLQNEIERAVIICNENIITNTYFEHLVSDKIDVDKEHIKERDFNIRVDKFKLKIIKEALLENNYNWSKTATYLNLSRQSLKRIYDRIIDKDK